MACRGGAGFGWHGLGKAIGRGSQSPRPIACLSAHPCSVARHPSGMDPLFATREQAEAARWVYAPNTAAWLYSTHYGDYWRWAKTKAAAVRDSGDLRTDAEDSENDGQEEDHVHAADLTVTYTKVRLSGTEEVLRAFYEYASRHGRAAGYSDVHLVVLSGDQPQVSVRDKADFLDGYLQVAFAD